MIDCEVYSEDTISLKRIRQPGDRRAKSDTEWASLVMDVMDKLKDVFVPLMADVLLYCYYKNSNSVLTENPKNYISLTVTIHMVVLGLYLY